MANYYHVRLLAASGQPLHRATVFTLAKALKQLKGFSGVDFPYQVVHRHLKAGLGAVWAEACVVPALGGACIAVLQDAGPTAGPTAGDSSSWWERDPASAPASALPVGFVRQEKPCVCWTDRDWERYREGSQIWMFVEE